MANENVEDFADYRGDAGTVLDDTVFKYCEDGTLVKPFQKFVFRGKYKGIGV